MPELTSVMAFSSSLASLCSTMRNTSPSSFLTIRPYPVGSGAVEVNTVTAARGRMSWRVTTSRSVAASRSGMSDVVTSTVPENPSGRPAMPAATASPVPFCCSWTAVDTGTPRSAASSCTAADTNSRW